MEEIILRLTRDDCNVAADALLTLGLKEVAKKLIAATRPRGTWVRHGRGWCILCDPDIREGDPVFVQRRDTGIREVIAGEIIERRGKRVMRRFKRPACKKIVRAA